MSSDNKVIVTPSTVVEYYRKKCGLTTKDLGIAPVVVLSWGRGLTRSLAEQMGASEWLDWMYPERHPLYRGEVGEHPVSFCHVPIGAPGTIALMEEMIVCGAEVFIGFGTAGSIQPSVPIGMGIIPTGCVSEEGTSRHYVDSDTKIESNAGLATLLEEACGQESLDVATGTLLSTDAPYRELQSRMRTLRGEGVLGVDMETSAMYALGLYRGVKVCNLLIVSDEDWEEWRPAGGSEAFREARERAKRAIISVLTKAAAVK